MNRVSLDILARDIRKKIFYRNGLLIIVAALLVFIYRMTVIHPYYVNYMLSFVSALTVLIYLFYNPKVCVVLMTIWIPFRSFLTEGFGDRFAFLGYNVFAVLPAEMKYLEMVLLAILTARWLSRKIFNRESYIRTPMDLPILIFTSLALISSVFNLTPPIIALAGVRTFLQFGLFYYAIVQLKFDEKFLKKMVILYIATAMVQTPLSLYNYFKAQATAIFEDVAVGDATLGTLMGGTNLLAHYEGMMMCIALGLIKFDSKKIIRYSFLFFWYMISFFTASGRGALYIFPFAAMLVLNQDVKRIIDFVKSYSIYILVFIICIMFFYLSGIKDAFYGKHLEDLDPGWIYEQFTWEGQRGWYRGRGGRLIKYKITMESLDEQPFGYFLGVGPGMFLSNTGIYFEVPLYQKYNRTSLWRKKNADRLVYPPDIAVILGEFGFLGLFAFGFIILRIYKIIRKGINSFNDPFWKGISAGVFGVLVLTIVAAFAERTFEAVYMQYLLWFFAAVIYKVDTIKETENTDERE